jgi:hypothetical protein
MSDCYQADIVANLNEQPQGIGRDCVGIKRIRRLV